VLSRSWSMFCLSHRLMFFLKDLYILYTMIHNRKQKHMHAARDSSFGIATRYGLDDSGIESWWGRDFSHPSRPALGPTQPPIQWVPGLSRGGKAAGASFHHPSHLGPRLKKSRAIRLLSFWAFVACSRVNFTFSFTLAAKVKTVLVTRWLYIWLDIDWKFSNFWSFRKKSANNWRITEVRSCSTDFLLFISCCSDNF
jgi:hypothetical protein